MKQKVWVIDDPSWQEAPERIRGEEPGPKTTAAEGGPLTASSTKSPALSFSLSMVVWGSGQLYAGAFRPGAMYLFAMLIFHAPLAALVFFRNATDRFVAGSNLPTTVLAAGSLVYLSAGLSCWLANALDAYYRTTRMRAEVFRGVDNEFWPLCGSALFPGWGQFLNGQPKKGLFFLLWGGAGILAICILAFAPYLWPLFEAGPVGQAFETGLVAALAVLPISLLMWVVAGYDAFVSCKELFIEKLRKYPTGSRVRNRKFLKSFVPRWTAILALLLAVSVAYQSIPGAFYRRALEGLRTETRSRNMVLIPELIDRGIELFDGQR